MVAIVMLNKDLFFSRFDIIAMIMAVGNGIEVGGGGTMDGCSVCRWWKHSRDGLMAKTVVNVMILMSYCFLSITLPQEIAATCVVGALRIDICALALELVLPSSKKFILFLSSFLQFVRVFEKANPTFTMLHVLNREGSSSSRRKLVQIQ